MLIFLGVPGFIFIYPAVTNKRWPTVPEVSILVLIVILFVILLRIIGAVMTVFKYANWDQLFNEIYAKVEGENVGALEDKVEKVAFPKPINEDLKKHEEKGNKKDGK
jgi:hypothetical protein